MSQQWEYCRLQLDSGMYSQSQTAKRYPYYIRIQIEYFSAGEPISNSFSRDTDKMDEPNRVWGQAIGLLGAAGWEMLSINLGKIRDMTLLDATAYFKRPIEAGRRVDEPKVKL
jgi:hypothetical protein